MSSAVWPNFKNFAEKVLVGPVNSAQDPLIQTQMQLNTTFSNIQMEVKALFGLFFFINQFPSLITHYSSRITLNTTPVWHHYSIFFTLFVGLIPVTHCRLLFFFFSSVPKLTLPSGKKKKKKKDMKTEPVKKD